MFSGIVVLTTVFAALAIGIAFGWAALAAVLYAINWRNQKTRPAAEAPGTQAIAARA